MLRDDAVIGVRSERARWRMKEGWGTDGCDHAAISPFIHMCCPASSRSANSLSFRSVISHPGAMHNPDRQSAVNRAVSHGGGRLYLKF